MVVGSGGLFRNLPLAKGPDRDALVRDFLARRSTGASGSEREPDTRPDRLMCFRAPPSASQADAMERVSEQDEDGDTSAMRLSDRLCANARAHMYHAFAVR